MYIVSILVAVMTVELDATRELFHKWFIASKVNRMTIKSFNSSPNSTKYFINQFYTCHGTSAIVICVKIWTRGKDPCLVAQV